MELHAVQARVSQGPDLVLRGNRAPSEWGYDPVCDAN